MHGILVLSGGWPEHGILFGCGHVHVAQRDEIITLLSTVANDKEGNNTSDDDRCDHASSNTSLGPDGETSPAAAVKTAAVLGPCAVAQARSAVVA